MYQEKINSATFLLSPTHLDVSEYILSYRIKFLKLTLEISASRTPGENPTATSQRYATLYLNDHSVICKPHQRSMSRTKDGSDKQVTEAPAGQLAPQMGY